MKLISCVSVASSIAAVAPGACASVPDRSAHRNVTPHWHAPLPYGSDVATLRRLFGALLVIPAVFTYVDDVVEWTRRQLHRHQLHVDAVLASGAGAAG